MKGTHIRIRFHVEAKQSNLRNPLNACDLIAR